MPWTSTVYRFGSAATLNSGLEVSGTALAVPTDGSSGIVVTYASPFPNSTVAVELTVQNNPTANPWNLSASVDPASVTKSGFTCYVTGGPDALHTVSVYYKATGS